MEAGIRDRSLEAVLAAAAVETASKAELARLCDGHLRRHYGRALLAATDAAARLQLVEEYLELSVALANEELMSKSTPVLVVLAEAFETSPITDCAEIFSLVEARTEVWTQPAFFESIRNHLLRVCNQLLRRLSRTLHTELAGRILIFLARTLPLTERSGLNLVGSFNLNNKTEYQLVDDEEPPPPPPAKKPKVEGAEGGEAEEMEEGEMDDTAPPKSETPTPAAAKPTPNAHSTVPVDHQLYVKFWQLQEAFSSPNSCFEKLAWKTFQRNANDVLAVLSSYKLERPQEESKGGEDEEAGEEAMETSEAKASLAQGHHDYFAKYLTSKKLLQLQLNDSTFRRYALVQFLILRQYLEAECKFKDRRRHVLDEAGKRWLGDLEKRCYSLLKETYPDGPHFAASMRQLLEREAKWSEWKNAGCKDVTSFADPKQKMPKFRRAAKDRFDPSRQDMGNAELSRLWNYEPDTLAFCRSAARKFTPALEEFLEDPWEQADPANGIEEGYKLVKDEAWRWSASRLLLEATPVFLTEPATGSTPHAQVQDIPAHLEKIILKVAGDMPKFKELKERRAFERAKESAEAAERERKAKEAEEAAKEAEEKRRAAAEDVTIISKEVAEEDDGKDGGEDGEEEDEDGEEGQIQGSQAPQVPQETLAKLAKVIGKDWPKLAKEANLEKEQKKALAKDAPEAAALTCLQQWTEGGSGTVRGLRNMLLKAGLYNEGINELLLFEESRPT